MIWSARRIVASRCAMVKVVESDRRTFCRASFTRYSEFASNALVAIVSRVYKLDHLRPESEYQDSESMLAQLQSSIR